MTICLYSVSLINGLPYIIISDDRFVYILCNILRKCFEFYADIKLKDIYYRIGNNFAVLTELMHISRGMSAEE